MTAAVVAFPRPHRRRVRLDLPLLEREAFAAHRLALEHPTEANRDAAGLLVSRFLDAMRAAYPAQERRP